MHEVRRDDGELCGYVAELDGQWLALTVFGATLAVGVVAGTTISQHLQRGQAERGQLRLFYDRARRLLNR